MNWAGLDHPVELAALGWVLFAALVAHAGFVLLRPAARREFLPLSIQQHAWLAGIVCLGVLWSLRIRIGDAGQLSMIGVSLYALVFGYTRALLGAAVALVGLTALTHGAWLGVGLTGLLIAALPAAVAALLQRALRARLPLHLFVFIIGNGLFASLVASSCADLGLLAAQFALAQAEVPNAGEVIGYALLLAWGEALASGMVFSALVIFRPQIVMTYAQDDYLRR
ncbi:MAG: energy-coupling factor ABC transporter permease [Gemmatimonadota bacterium]